jgi:hypothetical protein
MKPQTLLRGVGIAVIVSLAWPAIATAQRLTPLPHAMPGGPRPAALAPLSAARASAVASRWTPLTNQPTFLTCGTPNANGAANPVLLTDGSVLVQDAGCQDWWKLTPDQHGSYVSGTWTQIASLAADYSPLYHSSAVLPDGRLIIEGGEYNFFVPVWTTLGAIYDPIADTWTPVAPPPFFSAFGGTIGDAQSVVLANGTYMQANCCTPQAALLDAESLTWTPTGSGKFDVNDEEGWTLLPDGTVLAVDAYVGSYSANATGSEIYHPRSGAWKSAGSTIVQLWDSCGGANVASDELGPAVLRPDGTVFYTGSNGCAAGHTAIYNSRRGTWRAGPDFPDGLDIADGPAALEPNGRVLMMASPGIFQVGAVFLEWDGRRLHEVPGTPNAPIESSYYGNMLVLPTGQILLTDFSNDIEIYTPQPPSDDLLEEEQPIVAFSPRHVRAGHSYHISGFRFNGVSQGAAYGDDVQAATNYPLVRIKNLASGHVFYARTHDHSSMAVASQDFVWTRFDVSSQQESGPSRLVVVVNGVASRPVSVQVDRGEDDRIRRRVT